jgi:hypothetical protein
VQGHGARIPTASLSVEHALRGIGAAVTGQQVRHHADNHDVGKHLRSEKLRGHDRERERRIRRCAKTAARPTPAPSSRGIPRPGEHATQGGPDDERSRHLSTEEPRRVPKLDRENRRAFPGLGGYEGGTLQT